MSLNIRRSLALLSVPFVALAAYVISVLWRVSLAEEAVFNKSCLIRVSPWQRRYDGPRSLVYPGNATYTAHFDGHDFVAFGQKINGFQHMYGSALVSYELGEDFSKWLFAANEFAEWTFDWNGVRVEDLMDRKKDLVNNALGRRLGRRVADEGIGPFQAEMVLVSRSYRLMETSDEFLPHWMDQRLLRYPDEASLGCPGLPKRNVFNWIYKPEKFARLLSILRLPFTVVRVNYGDLVHALSC